MYGHRTIAMYRREVSSQPINGGNLIWAMQISTVVVFRSAIHHPAKQVIESQLEIMKTHPLFCQRSS